MQPTDPAFESPQAEEMDVTLAWRALLAEAEDRPWMLRLLRERGAALLARFVQRYQELLSLSRQRRRALLRQAGMGLAGAALLLAMSGAPAFAVPTPASPNANINSSDCDLIDAITAANTDTATGSCNAGNAGADTITLLADVVLTTANNGYNGLPIVTSEITIQGNGHTISRDAGAAADFRIFYVPDSGDLTLYNVTISGGRAEGGGGIYNKGILTINNSTISDNTALTFPGGGGTPGGGILSGNTIAGTAILTVNNSTISGNTAVGGHGGGIDNYFNSVATISNSTITGNSAYRGGGIAQGGYYGSGMITLNHTLISGNTATFANEVKWYTGAGLTGATTFNANNENLIGHSGETDAQAFEGFDPSGSDIDATSDGGGTPTALTSILNSTLANNGGPTMTHALVTGSPAIDAIAIGSRMARSGDAVAATPLLCTAGSSYDQRGVFRANSPTDTTGTACDIGAFEFGQTATAVTIAGFSAETVWGTGPKLAWETASESGLSGFHIWRGSAEKAETRITSELIGASGGLTGQEYTWQDATSFGWGQRKYYWLEAVEANGSNTFTGPVEVWGIGQLFLPSIGR